ncbi:hypothetical protein [Haliangium sp.]|uniref:hypothetical protein n=1 Tax=Haliangium sp. TaxID=2663208 RepID=UPI003D12192D
MHVLDGEICVARAQGPGVGRFLAASLVDALAGGELVEVRAAAGLPSERALRPGEQVVEFVFASIDRAGEAGDADEIIRVGVDAVGRVRSTELWRRPRPVRDRAPLVFSEDLAEALGAGHVVARLSWSPGAAGSSLVITTAAQTDFRLASGEVAASE